jgi:TPR repeat protein
MQIVEYFDVIEEFELYIMVGLFIFTLWFIFNTIAYYKGEKRKLKHLHRFAQEGEADAQQSLAQRYQKGDAVKKSCHRAAFWYQKAAFSGHEEAKHFLEKIRKKKRC